MSKFMSRYPLITISLVVVIIVFFYRHVTVTFH